MSTSRQPSENFIQAFSSGSGGTVRTCACGVTFFDGSSPSHFDEGELESLIAQREKNPAKFVETDCTVSTMTIAGQEYVIGCQHCEAPAKCEAWITAHARQLSEWLSTRANELEREAKIIRPKV